MDRRTLIAFHEELVKLAYGPRDIDRILRLSKQNIFKAPTRSIFGKPALIPKGELESKERTFRYFAKILADDPEEVAKMTRWANEAAAQAKILSGKLLMPRDGGGSVGYIRRVAPAVKDIKLTGPQRKATESIVRGHEMDERALTKVKGSVMGDFHHRSPEVILRERNRILTLPGGNEPVRDFFQAMRTAIKRKGDSEAGLLERATKGVSGKGIQYGEGRRLSRHARKRVTRLMEEQGLKERALREQSAGLI